MNRFYETRSSSFSRSKWLCCYTYSSLLLLLFILSRWWGFDRGTLLGGTEHVLRWIDLKCRNTRMQRSKALFNIWNSIIVIVQFTMTIKTPYVLHEKSTGKSIIYCTVSTYRSSWLSVSSCSAVWDDPLRWGSKLELAMATDLQATLQK